MSQYLELFQSQRALIDGNRDKGKHFTLHRSSMLPLTPGLASGSMRR